MQAIKASLLMAAASAVSLQRHHHHHRNHDGEYLVSLNAMLGKGPDVYAEGAHWRKAWPEGAIDNGHNDDLVMNLK